MNDQVRGGRPIAPHRFFAVVLLLALLLASPTQGGASIHAQEERFASGAAPAPLNGAGAVVFVSQAVDARLVRGEDGVYRVRADGVLRLHNTDRFKDASVTLGWPGWPGGDVHFDPAQLPGFAPSKGGTPLPTELETRPTTWAGEQRESEWLVTQTSIGRDARERIAFNWTEILGTGPLLTYSFGLLPAGAWPQPVGSARITLELPEFASEEMVVRAEPQAYTFTGTTIEWLLVEEEPAINPSVTFIAPHVWQEIEGARIARETDPVNANLRLVELYQQLVDAGVERYQGEVEATLLAAHEAAPENPEPLLRLAAHYRERAAGTDLALLEQAATFTEQAVAAGATDPATRETLVQELGALASAWAESDPVLALGFIERAEAVGGDPVRFASQRQALAETIALQVLAAEGLPEAMAVAERYGLPTDVVEFPWLSSAIVEIGNGAEGRVVRLHMTGDEATLDTEVGALVDGLTEAGYTAEWDGRTLSFNLPGGPTAWRQNGAAIAAVLSDAPEWDLLRGVLVPPSLEYASQSDAFQNLYMYQEAVHVETRAASIADELRQDADKSSSPWEQALLEEAANRWQALANSQTIRVVTRFEAGQTLQREWELVPPVEQVLEWSGDEPRRDRWLQGAAAGALLLLGVLGVVWLPGGRTRRARR